MIAPTKITASGKVAVAVALAAVPFAGWLWVTTRNAAARQDQAEEKGADYDTSTLAAIDPALFKYQQVAQIDSGMKSPKAIAFDAKGRLLIVGDQFLRVLDGQAEVVHAELPETPRAIAPARDGSILVAFRRHVQRFDSSGRPLASWPSFGDKALLSGLAERSGEVLVADSGQRVVFRCDAGGHVLGEIGRKDDSRGVEGLVLPSPYLTVAYDAAGEILVSNPGLHRIETYDTDGEPRGYFGHAGTGVADFLGCCNPACFAVLSDGRIVTVEKGVPRIKIFHDDQGQWRLDGYVAGPKTLGTNHLGFKVAIDASDRILVMEPANPNIRVFAPMVSTRDKAP